MSSLLKRQIRKHLIKSVAENKLLEDFLDAVAKSYTTFEDQYNMQQRAMAISSQELYEANKRLRKEADSQKKIIDRLKSVTQTLKDTANNSKLTEGNQELDEFKLLDLINNQAKEIVEANEQREKLLSELEHQNKELSDYAHMVSHDLKSPLRSIDTLSKWLSEDYEDKIDEVGQQNLSLIRTNVGKMDSLITGILEYSTIGKKEIQLYDLDLDNLVNGIVDFLHVPEHINITVHKLPVVYGDKHRLQQVFQNLISNAIKYNDKKNGTVEVGYLDKGFYWEFYIKDNGKGIEQVYYQKIFETFSKLENNVDSTGIGLSIVKKIIEVYSGKIWLTSKPGKGSTFYFTIKKKL